MIKLENLENNKKTIKIKDLDKVKFSNFIVFGFYEKSFKNGSNFYIEDISKFGRFFQDYEEFRRFKFVENCSFFVFYQLKSKHSEDEIDEIIKIINSRYSKRNSC